MRIAVFLTTFPKTSQTFVLQHIAFLVNCGYKVDIYAYRPDEVTPSHVALSNLNLLDKIYYFSKIPRFSSLSLTRKAALFTNYLARNHPLLSEVEGLEEYSKRKKKHLLKISLLVYFFARYIVSGRDHSPKVRKFFRIKNFKELKKYYKNKRQKNSFLDLLLLADLFASNGADYDVIHCHFGPNGALASWLTNKGMLSGKLVTTFHGYDVTSFVKQNERSYYDLLWKTGDQFLPVSNHMRDILVDLGCPEQKITVHHMGIDPSKFLPSPKSNEENMIELVSVCRLVEKKGISFAIEAIKELQNNSSTSYFNLAYKIVGDGPHFAKLEEQVRMNNLTQNVEFLGIRSQNEVLEILGKSDILLAPSITASDGDQEGIPVVIMEAMAMEVPVVSSYHSGIPELVDDGKTGFLVPEKDVSKLYQAINTLIGDQNLRIEMGKRGRKKVLKDFNSFKLNNELLQIYRRLKDDKDC